MDKMGKTIHPFLTIFIPVSFLYTLIYVIFYPLVSTFIDFPPLFPVLLLLAGISETITGNMLYKERIGGIAPRLRELVFVLLLGFFFIVLLNGDLIGGRITLKNLSLWVALILIALQWFLSNFVHKKLKDRELFFHFFEGKEEKEYKSIYQAHSHEGSESVKGLKSIRRILTAFMVLNFIGAVIVFWFAKQEISSLNTALLFLYFAVSMILISTLNGFMEIQYIIMDGLLVSKVQRGKRTVVLFLLIIGISVLAVPIVGEKPVMPSTYLSAFYDWLQSLAQRRRVNIVQESPKFKKTVETEIEEKRFLQQLDGELKKTADLARLKKIIQWIFLGLAGVLIIWFLFRPLFRRDTAFHPLKSLKNGWSLLKENIKKVLFQFKNMLSSFGESRGSSVWKGNRRGRRLSAKAKKQAARAASQGLRERIEMGRFLRAFFKLTRWGEKKGVSFRRTIGPREYALTLEEKIAGLNNLSLEIADTFEEAVYSNHEIGTDKRSDYFKKVKIVIKEKYIGKDK